MIPTFSPATSPAIAPSPRAAFASLAAPAAMGCGVLLALWFHLFYWGHTVVMEGADPRVLAQFGGQGN